METICHCVTNNFWSNYKISSFHFFFLESALLSKSVIIFFRQLLKRLACNFFTWNGPWRVFPIYSGQYSAPSRPACTHPDSGIGDAKSCTYQQWALRTKYLWRLFLLLYVEHVLSSAIWVDIVSSPHVNSTILCGVLIV